MGTDQDPVPKNIAFVRKCCNVVRGPVLCVLESKETDVVRRSPVTANVFASTPAGSRT